MSQQKVRKRARGSASATSLAQLAECELSVWLTRLAKERGVARQGRNAGARAAGDEMHRQQDRMSRIFMGRVNKGGSNG